MKPKAQLICNTFLVYDNLAGTDCIVQTLKTLYLLSNHLFHTV